MTSVSQLFHGPTPRSPLLLKLSLVKGWGGECHRLSIRLRRSLDFHARQGAPRRVLSLPCTHCRPTPSSLCRPAGTWSLPREAPTTGERTELCSGSAPRQQLLRSPRIRRCRAARRQTRSMSSPSSIFVQWGFRRPRALGRALCPAPCAPTFCKPSAPWPLTYSTRRSPARRARRARRSRWTL